MLKSREQEGGLKSFTINLKLQIHKSGVEKMTKERSRLEQWKTQISSLAGFLKNLTGACFMRTPALVDQQSRYTTLSSCYQMHILGACGFR